MTRDVADSLELYGELHRYIPVLAAWNGFVVGEVDVNHRPRLHGESKFKKARFWRGFFDLVTVKFLTTYTGRPFHLFGGIGFALSALGSGMLGWLVFTKLTGHAIGERPALFAGVILAARRRAAPVGRSARGADRALPQHVAPPSSVRRRALAATGRDLTQSPERSSKCGRIVRIVLAAAGLAFLVVALIDTWDRSERLLRSPVRLACAFAVVVLSLMLWARAWSALLGHEAEPRALRHGFYLSQLGKYVPGGIWQAAGLVSLGRDAGADLARVDRIRGPRGRAGRGRGDGRRARRDRRARSPGTASHRGDRRPVPRRARAPRVDGADAAARIGQS